MNQHLLNPPPVSNPPARTGTDRMNPEAPAAFHTALGELLFAELRRQGVPRAAERAQAIMLRVRVDNAGGAAASALFALGGMGLGDGEAIAVAEALLKLGAPQAQRGHGVRRWSLFLNDNALTDRSAAHLSLLASRCAPPLVLLDAGGNAITPEAARAVEEAQGTAPTPCTVRLSSGGGSGGKAPGGGKDTESRCRSASAASVLRGSFATSSEAGSEALRKRRAALFAEKGKPNGAANSNDSGGAPAAPGGSSVLGAGWLEHPPPGRQRAPAKGETPTTDAAAAAAVAAPGGNEARHFGAMEGIARNPPALGPAPLSTGNGGGHGTRSGGKADEEESTRATCRPKRAGEEEEDEPVDVTSNLNPLLSAVLDLSNMVPDGRLRELYDTDNIWDVVGRSNWQVMPHSPGVGLEAPFQSLTVLCVRQNGLKSLGVLPPSLLRLDVSCNELRDISGVSQCRMLTLLNARRNHLSSMLGLERNPALSHLFLGHNEIAFIEGIAHLILLETLDLSHNRFKTRSSIRPLSLSKSLRHLILRGNPVMERMKGSCRPLLRNLCPSLVSIDGDRLTFSRIAAKAQQECSALYLSSSPTRRIAGGGNISVLSSEDSGSLDRTKCANYMQLLTRGAASGVGSGYGDARKAAHTAKVLQVQAAAAATKEYKKKKLGNPSGRGGGGELIRQELMKKLAQESKKYLESMLEERLTNIQGLTINNSSIPHDIEGSGDGGSDKNEPHSSVSSIRCSEPIQDIVLPLRDIMSSDIRDGHNNGKRRASQFAKQTATVHRDETLSHEQWLRIREGQTVRRAPFGDTPNCRGGRRRLTTPDMTENKSMENMIYLSPIRKAEDETQGVSINATQILHHVNMLEPRVDVNDGTTTAKKRLNPRLLESKLSRPMLLSPSSDFTPVKAYRAEPSFKSQRRSRPFALQSPPQTEQNNKTNKQLFFSPPPPFSSPSSGLTESKDFNIKNWVVQLCEDTKAVQDALQTLVSLLDSQKSEISVVFDKKNFIPNELLQERKRCVDILTESGMLLDTEVPLEVVEHYEFTSDELKLISDDSEDDIDEEMDCAVISSFSGTKGEILRERREILRCIRILGDGKTCLRYLVLLMEEGKEEELQHYVKELKALLMCE